MPDIFDEVEEELRRERAARLWKRYGWILGLVVVLAIGGTAGWQVWSHQQRQNAQAATARLLEAMRNPASPEAGAALEALARAAAPGPRTLARLTEAARRATAGETAAALPLWQAVAGDAGADPLYRDLASLLLAMHTLDAGDPAELAARLSPLAAPGNPWRHNAAELLALLAERRGDRPGAIAGFRALAADSDAPAGIRTRAEQMLFVLGAGRPGGAS